MPQNPTVTAGQCATLLWQFQCSVKAKSWGKLTKGVLFQGDSVLPTPSARTVPHPHANCCHDSV